MTDVSAARTASPAEPPGAGGFDFAHLERVVGELIEERHRLSAENDLLREELVVRERKIADLDDRLTRQEQRRHDALKRIDDLLAQVEGFATLANQAAEG